MALLAAQGLRPSAVEALSSDFIYAQGNRLMLSGQPWRAVGVNFWDLEAFKVLAGDASGCYYQHPDLDAYFDASFKTISDTTHATVVRTFAFQQFYTEGGRTWDSTDKLLHYAQKYNIRIIPVLGTQFGVCGEKHKSPSWYHCPIPSSVAAIFPSDVTYCTTHGNVPGYKTVGETGPYDVSFRQYAVAAAARYKNDPTIAFWQLMNEAVNLGPGSTYDPTSLIDFSNDMVSAIRNDGGDGNHLINLGTLGGISASRPAYGQLLACDDPSAPGGGGCNDLAEAHDYSSTPPLAGIPFNWSSLGTNFRWVGCTESSADVDVWVDGWQAATNPATGQQDPLKPRLASGIPGCATDWKLRFTVPAQSEATVLVDDVRVNRGASVQLFTFETGTEGFTSTDPSVVSISHSTERAHYGQGALRVDLRNTGSTSTWAYVDAPAFPAPLPSVPGAPTIPSEVHAWVSANFTAPISDAAPINPTIASDLHDAVVRYQKPFFIGEVGIPAHVPGANPLFELPGGSCTPPNCALNQITLGCSGIASNPQAGTRVDRAVKYDQMMSFQFDQWHQSSGWIAWDFKDPTQLTSTSDGTPQLDPMINCFTIAPGDPATEIIKKYADLTPNSPALPAPGSAPVGSDELMVLQRFPSVASGSTMTIRVRTIRGGNALPTVPISASGGCSGTTTTDALGFASFTCAVASTPGSYTLALSAFPCCTVVSRTFPLTVT